ncbi:MAG: hypothetical protein ABSG79_04100 [Bryobacteraceae bacterium]|jgi:septal ring factor EnvC (AmiA/AmiB activator)
MGQDMKSDGALVPTEKRSLVLKPRKIGGADGLFLSDAEVALALGIHANMRCDKLEDDVKQLDARVTRTESDIADVKARLSAVEREGQQHRERIAAIEAKLTVVEAQALSALRLARQALASGDRTARAAALSQVLAAGACLRSAGASSMSVALAQQLNGMMRQLGG